MWRKDDICFKFTLSLHQKQMLNFSQTFAKHLPWVLKLLNFLSANSNKHSAK